MSKVSESVSLFGKLKSKTVKLFKSDKVIQRLLKPAFQRFHFFLLLLKKCIFKKLDKCNLLDSCGLLRGLTNKTCTPLVFYFISRV